MQSKQTIRFSLLQKRKSLNKATVAEHSLKIYQKLIELSEFQSAQKIGFYWPLQEEIDTLPLMAKCWALEKKCYLPKIITKNNMNFCLYKQDAALQLNLLKLYEPEAHESILPTELDLVFVPLIGFDATGYRIGFGSGNYDRCFNFKREMPQARPLLVGLAHSFQQVDTIYPDPWDIRLNTIFTEKKVLLVT